VQSARGDLALDHSAIHIRHREHPADIAQMFFTSAFAKKLQLLYDDEFRRREPDGRFARHYGATILKGPALKLMSRRQINVSLIYRVVMDEIKMSVLRSRRFRMDDLSRRTIKICLRKKGHKSRRFMSSYDGDDIEIQRGAPLAVCA